LTGVTEYTYDEWGNEILNAEHDAAGALLNKMESVYDKDGHMLLDSYTSAGYTITTENAFNEKGDLIMCIETYNDIVEVYEYAYEYNDAGRITKETWILNGELGG